MSLFVIVLTLPLTVVEDAADDESAGDGDEVLDYELAFGSQEEGDETLGGNVGLTTSTRKAPTVY